MFSLIPDLHFYNAPQAPSYPTFGTKTNVMIQRARAFFSSDIPAGFPICGPNGSRVKRQQGVVAPTYSLGPFMIIESLLPLNHKVLLDWLSEVAFSEGTFENPEVFEDEESDNEDGPGEDWANESLEERKGMVIEEIKEGVEEKQGMVIEEVKEGTLPAYIGEVKK